MSWLRIRKAKAQQAQSLQELPWYLRVNNVESIWERTKEGKGAFITIYDSCISENHPGLIGRAVNYEKCNLYTKQGDAAKQHGTVVAGVITTKSDLYKGRNVANGENLGEIRVSGVAPEAAVLVVNKFTSIAQDPVLFAPQLKEILKKRLSEQGYNIELIVEQNFINYSGDGNRNDWTNKGDPEVSPCDIIQNTNILVTAAIANNAGQLKINGQSVIFPASLNKAACANNILRVAGTNYYDNTIPISKFKNIPYHSTFTDIYVPAQRHSVLIPEDQGYLAEYPMQGTSEAAPLIAGTLALMSVCKPNAQPSELKNSIITNSDTNQIALDNVSLLQIYGVIKAFCEEFPGNDEL